MTDHRNDPAAKPMAIFLWVVVAVALIFGIVQTAGDAVALFTN